MKALRVRSISGAHENVLSYFIILRSRALQHSLSRLIFLILISVFGAPCITIILNMIAQRQNLTKLTKSAT